MIGLSKIETLLSAIVTWLALNFGLPATYDHPRIEFLPATTISDLRYKELGEPQRRQVVAVYDDKAHIIFLPHDWNEQSPADLSVLVHEMVHHLQNVGRLRYECAAAREKLAYQAQQRWLGYFGGDLFAEFDLDRLTLKLTTSCYR